MVDVCIGNKNSSPSSEKSAPKYSKEQSNYVRIPKKIGVAKDKLVAAGDKIKDSQLISITLGGLGMEYTNRLLPQLSRVLITRWLS